MYCAAQREGDGVVLALSGEWRVAALAAIGAELTAVPLAGVQRLKVQADGARLRHLRRPGCCAIYLARAAAAGVRTSFSGTPPPALGLLDRTLAAPAARGREIAASGEWLDAAAAVEGLGRRTVRSWELLESALDFVGRVTVAACAAACSCAAGGRPRSRATCTTPASPPCRSSR